MKLQQILMQTFSARELELEDRQGRLQQQLRDSMSLDGMYLISLPILLVVCTRLALSHLFGLYNIQILTVLPEPLF